jgi:hypothetical protein
MLAIHINETTQQYIADLYNEGVVPALGKDDPGADDQDTYYIVTEDDRPNFIVRSDVFVDKGYKSEVRNIVIAIDGYRLDTSNGGN